jgi:uncharacterized membrane-anchored protein YitT (DUF2179 family)
MKPNIFKRGISFFINNKSINKEYEASRYRIAKAYHLLRRSVRRGAKNILFIILAVLSATFGLKSFLLPNVIIDGGATGLSLLLAQITKIHLSYLLIIINIPFILIGIKQVGRDFAIKASLAIFGLALSVTVLHFPVITSDKLLVAVFGGFFLGAGIGLAMRGGAVIDGTEILAIYFYRKFYITVGDVILIINIMIFSAAAYFLSVETALYSVLTYISASRTVNFFVEGIEEYIGITIISAKNEQIRVMIIEKLGRGVTIYKGKRGFGKTGIYRSEVDIIFTVITRLELSKLNAEVDKIDPNAFIVMNSIKDARGGMIKKRPFIHN